MLSMQIKNIITIGKLKQAYNLSEYDIDALFNALLPDKVFPYALWQQAYDNFWAEAIKSAAFCYNIVAIHLPIPVPLPEKHFPNSYYRNITNSFFADLLRTVKSSDLKNGINYIMDATYGDEFTRDEEADAFFSALAQDEWHEENRNRTTGHLIIQSMAATEYSFVSDSFIDTVMVDKKAAILWLFHEGHRHDKEVKGLSKALVDSIIASGTLPIPTNAHQEPLHISMTVMNEVHQTPIIVQPPEVSVNIENTVQPTPVNITNEVQPTPVVVSNEVSTPAVNITNEVQPTPVNVTNEIHQAPVNEAPVKKIPANARVVPRSLWAGKTPEFIHNALAQLGFDTPEIAHVLFYKRGIDNKRLVGKLLHSDPNLTEYAYDKNGADLYRDSKNIIILDEEDL